MVGGGLVDRARRPRAQRPPAQARRPAPGLAHRQAERLRRADRGAGARGPAGARTHAGHPRAGVRGGRDPVLRGQAVPRRRRRAGGGDRRAGNSLAPVVRRDRSDRGRDPSGRVARLAGLAGTPDGAFPLPANARCLACHPRRARLPGDQQGGSHRFSHLRVSGEHDAGSARGPGVSRPRIARLQRGRVGPDQRAHLCVRPRVLHAPRDRGHRTAGSKLVAAASAARRWRGGRRRPAVRRCDRPRRRSARHAAHLATTRIRGHRGQAGESGGVEIARGARPAWDLSGTSRRSDLRSRIAADYVAASDDRAARRRVRRAPRVRRWPPARRHADAGAGQ